MAMVVKNNMSAVNTLNVLNANSTALAKDLQQVATGMKVNSAADDNSGYAISERMQARIRALEQADQNTQNGANMLKVAEGAVSSTVDILRSMKEKAINAANDSNTDADRATIQKELDQSIDQIDDNALITYNGKALVDGSKMAKGAATKTSLTNQSLSEDTTGETKLVDLANRNGEGLHIQTTDTLTVSYVIQGHTYSTDINIDENTTLNSVLKDAADPFTRNSPGASAIYSTFDFKSTVAHSTYNSTVNHASTTYYDETNTPQVLSQKDAMDAAGTSYNNAVTAYNNYNTPSAKSTAIYNYKYVSPGVEDDGLAEAAYNGTLAGLNSAKETRSTVYYNASTEYSTTTSTAAYTRDSTIAIAEEEFSTAMSNAYYEWGESLGDLVPYKFPLDESNAGNVVGKSASGDTVYTANREKALTISAASAGVKYQLSGLTFSVSDSEGKVKKSVNAVLDNFTETVRAVNKSNDNAITLQIDAKANQTIRISLTDMRSEALGLKSSDGATLSVATQKNANAAVNVLDNAIQKALDQQTDIGAVANRMGQTSYNLHIARDNVQASESTIRDADMAKAMTSYTKNNILLQAAQSMLAQANQSSSSVLSLLQ